ncbi:MAG: DUF4126 domain-containing protein [Gemmatimonadota bacterium]|jgi:hypothetical protein
MDALTRIAEVTAAATAAGINPWLAALTLVAMSHFDLLQLGTLPVVGEELGDPTILIAVGSAFVIEQVVDKIPALDHASDLVHLPIKPVAAVALAMAVAAPEDPSSLGDLAVPLGIAAAGLALVAHLGKAGLRAGSTAATAGTANPVLSVVEDLGVVTVIVLAVLVPIVALVLVALALWVAVKGLARLVRVFRRRRKRSRA